MSHSIISLCYIDTYKSGLRLFSFGRLLFKFDWLPADFDRIPHFRVMICQQSVFSPLFLHVKLTTLLCKDIIFAVVWWILYVYFSAEIMHKEMPAFFLFMEKSNQINFSRNEPLIFLNNRFNNKIN